MCSYTWVLTTKATSKETLTPSTFNYKAVVQEVGYIISLVYPKQTLPHTEVINLPLVHNMCDNPVIAVYLLYYIMLGVAAHSWGKFLLARHDIHSCQRQN